MDHAGLCLQILDNSTEKAFAGLAGKLAGGDQAEPGERAFPAGESFVFEPPMVQGTHADAVGIDRKAALFQEDPPVHRIGHAVEHARRDVAQVARVVPTSTDQFLVAVPRTGLAATRLEKICLIIVNTGTPAHNKASAAATQQQI